MPALAIGSHNLITEYGHRGPCTGFTYLLFYDECPDSVAHPAYVLCKRTGQGEEDGIVTAKLDEQKTEQTKAKIVEIVKTL